MFKLERFVALLLAAITVLSIMIQLYLGYYRICLPYEEITAIYNFRVLTSQQLVYLVLYTLVNAQHMLIVSISDIYIIFF